jgi:hypothetical protein
MFTFCAYDELHKEQKVPEHQTGKEGLSMRENMEQAIKDRLENGFKNWNGGYDGWLEWCTTLYEPDAHYNVQGQRWTLQQYKDAMKQLFAHFTMELGDFDNMIIRDDWCAIRYTVKIRNLDTGKEMLQHTMEFVNFKDNPDPVGVRVVEGWALSDTPISA